jgi:signal transduction histidine kinase
MHILKTLSRYGLAVGVAVAALGVHLALDMTHPTVLFLVAVVLSAWLWGLGPGVAAALTGAGLKVYYVIEPVGSVRLGGDDLVRVVTFVVAGVLVSALHHGRRRETQTQARLLVLEQQARAAAEGRSRANERFLAVTSHELRTPLAAILNWLSVLETRSADRDTVTRALRAIRQNAQMQARLIEDLLDVARIASGKLPMSMGVVDPLALVVDAVDTVRPAAESAGVAIDTRFDPRVSPVWGDAQRLAQVVLNVLSNAIKYTPAGGRIDVGLSAGEAGVRLVVRDTGRGIPSDFLPHVFEAFTQVASAAGTPGDGLGLGMAIVRELVQRHRGTIQVESLGRDRGTTVTITLPLASRREGVAAGVGPDAPRPAERDRR